MNNTWISWLSSLYSRWTQWTVVRTQLVYILMLPPFMRLNSEKKDLRKRDNIKKVLREKKLSFNLMLLPRLNTTGPRKYTNRQSLSIRWWESEQRFAIRPSKIESQSTSSLSSKFYLHFIHLQLQDLFPRLQNTLKNARLSSMIFLMEIMLDQALLIDWWYGIWTHRLWLERDSSMREKR